MNRKIMIKILERLEDAYPGTVLTEALYKNVGLKNIDGEFSKIIRYLRVTNKIVVVLPESKLAPTQRDVLLPRDEITINPSGIDLLTELKGLEINYKRDESVAKATVVLALVGFIQAILYFRQFSKEVTDFSSWILLMIMGVIVVVISQISWQSFYQMFSKNA